MFHDGLNNDDWYILLGAAFLVVARRECLHSMISDMSARGTTLGDHTGFSGIVLISNKRIRTNIDVITNFCCFMNKC